MSVPDREQEREQEHEQDRTRVSERVSDEVTRRTRAQQVALFRYQLICPALDPGLSTKARGRVVAAEHLGSDTFIHVEVAGAGRLTARTVGDMPVGTGDEVVLAPMAGHLHRFGADGRAV